MKVGICDAESRHQGQQFGYSWPSRSLLIRGGAQFTCSQYSSDVIVNERFVQNQLMRPHFPRHILHQWPLSRQCYTKRLQLYELVYFRAQGIREYGGTHAPDDRARGALGVFISADGELGEDVRGLQWLAGVATSGDIRAAVMTDRGFVVFSLVYSRALCLVWRVGGSRRIGVLVLL